jgi:hypothetical protein
MHRQPNGRPIGVRPFDAMFGMCRKLDVVSGRSVLIASNKADAPGLFLGVVPISKDGFT